jgi:transposase
MSRYDLTDFEWRVIEPLLPNKPRGVPRVDDRRVLNGIFWVLRSGAPWRDLPERYGPRYGVEQTSQTADIPFRA